MANRVDYVRPEVTWAQSEWQKVRDVVAGEKAVKDAGAKYLPPINPLDDSPENIERNKQYIFRTYYFNGTGRTLEGLVGIAFQQWPEIILPDAMAVMEEDADGAGGGLVNQSHRSLEELLVVGRGGLLVDYPETAVAVSLQDQNDSRVHSMIIQYKAEQIVNWRVGPSRLPELIVLHEVYEFENDYDVELKDQWRELRMIEGVYVLKIWRTPEKGNGPELISESIPKDGWGNPFDHIPFYFMGAMDNDAEIDKAPLLDLANANLAHYRSSANHFDAEYYVNQPQYWVIGADAQWMQEMKEAGIYFGSRAIGSIPSGGDVKLLQPAPNSMASESMNRIKQDMVSLGARLLTPGEAVKTTDQAKADIASSNSVLSLAADNISNAYTEALYDAAAFMRIETDEIVFKIHTDFGGVMIDTVALKELVAAWQAGSIPDSDHWSNMRQLGVIDPQKTDDEIEGELESSGAGLTLNLDADPALDAIPPVIETDEPIAQ